MGVEFSELYEAIKFHWLVAVFIPIFLIVTTPVYGAHEIPVFRLQQFDLSGSAFGSRAATLSLEATTQLSSTPSRQCLIARLTELSMESAQSLLAKGPGGLLLLLPETIQQVTVEQRQIIQAVEQYLTSESFLMPVFFAVETPEITEIYEAIERGLSSSAARSATDALLSSVLSTGFQLDASGAQSAALSSAQQHNLEARLHGLGAEDQLPTVLLVAHYDTMAAAPELSFGADSNASGVAALLELTRLFGKLYRSRGTHPRANLIALLSAGGKLNYAGSRRWLDDNADQVDSSIPQGVQFVLCLDSLAKGDSLSLHVSKPPKTDSAGHKFFQALQSAAADVAADVTVNMVHKKINLGERSLAWEHELYSMRRMPAFTLSHYQTAWDPSMRSLLDTRPSVDDQTLVRNTRVVAEALARFLYNLTDASSSQTAAHSGSNLVFADEMSVSSESVRAWLDYLSSTPRSAQLLTDPSHHVIATIRNSLQRDTHEVRVGSFSADRRQPDWVLYDVTSSTMTAYRVKPAVFDLVVTVVIAAYLGLIYLFVTNFHQVYRMAQMISPVNKVRVE